MSPNTNDALPSVQKFLNVIGAIQKTHKTLLANWKSLVLSQEQKHNKLKTNIDSTNQKTHLLKRISLCEGKNIRPFK